MRIGSMALIDKFLLAFMSVNRRNFSAHTFFFSELPAKLFLSVQFFGIFLCATNCLTSKNYVLCFLSNIK